MPAPSASIGDSDESALLGLGVIKLSFLYPQFLRGRLALPFEIQSPSGLSISCAGRYPLAQQHHSADPQPILLRPNRPAVAHLIVPLHRVEWSDANLLAQSPAPLSDDLSRHGIHGGRRWLLYE
jgi:hypothetical protein